MQDEAEAKSAPPITPLQLFLAFGKAGLCGFGGVAPWAHRILVEERRWLDDKAYAELLGLGQILPGPNVVNLSIMFGRRVAGPAGALAAFAGLMGPPLVVLVAIGSLYQSYGGHPTVQAVLGGMSAAAAGLVLGMAVKLARKLEAGPLLAGAGVLAFLGAGVLRWPLILVVLGLAPLAIAAARRRHTP
ncbi:MAG TPA: chromate transporter [Beijerinckiaceae bacterium]|jgi:chromate transporter